MDSCHRVGARQEREKGELHRSHEERLRAGARKANPPDERAGGEGYKMILCTMWMNLFYDDCHFRLDEYVLGRVIGPADNPRPSNLPVQPVRCKHSHTHQPCLSRRGKCRPIMDEQATPSVPALNLSAANSLSCC